MQHSKPPERREA